MTGKTIDKKKVGHFRVWSDDRVLIQRVVGIVTDPGVDQPDGFELWNPVKQDRPDLAFPEVRVRLEVVVVHGRVLVGGAASEIVPAVSSNMDPRRINRQGRGPV